MDFYHACFRAFFYGSKIHGLFYNGATPKAFGLQWKMLLMLSLATNPAFNEGIFPPESPRRIVESVSKAIFSSHNVPYIYADDEKADIVMETVAAWKSKNVSFDLINCKPRCLENPKAVVIIDNPLNPFTPSEPAPNQTDFRPPTAFSPITITNKQYFQKSINSICSFSGIEFLHQTPMTLAHLVLGEIGLNPWGPGTNPILTEISSTIAKRLAVLNDISTKWLAHRDTQIFKTGDPKEECGSSWLNSLTDSHESHSSLPSIEVHEVISLPPLPQALYTRNVSFTIPDLVKELHNSKAISWLKTALSIDNDALKMNTPLPHNPASFQDIPQSFNVSSNPRFKSGGNPKAKATATPLRSRPFLRPPVRQKSTITKQPGKYGFDVNGNRTFTNLEGTVWIKCFCLSRRNSVTGEQGGLRWKKAKPIHQGSSEKPHAKDTAEEAIIIKSDSPPKEASPPRTSIMAPPRTQPSVTTTVTSQEANSSKGNTLPPIILPKEPEEHRDTTQPPTASTPTGQESSTAAVIAIDPADGSDDDEASSGTAASSTSGGTSLPDFSEDEQPPNSSSSTIHHDASNGSSIE